MFQRIKNLRITGAPRRESVIKERITNRKRYSLFYKEQGQSLYDFNGRKLLFDTDNVLFLPKGSSFSYEKYGDIDGSFIGVSFDCEFDHPTEPTLYRLESPGQVRSLFLKIHQLFFCGGEIGRLEAYSYFYKLLAVLERNSQQAENLGYEDDRIKRSIIYMHEHLYDPQLRISDMSRISGVSAPSFRKLFMEKYKVTPKKYILQCRLRQAEELLRSGDYETLSQLSAMVGFEDQLYFSKCFKNLYGVSPSQYAKKIVPGHSSVQRLFLIILIRRTWWC